METQTLAIIYSLVFIGIEIIWLATIRNRYILLISCATILIGVEGLSLIISRDRMVMGNQYLLEYLAKLLLRDIILLVLVWLFFYSPLQFKSIKIPQSNQMANITNVFSGIDLIFSEVRPRTKAFLVLISFVVALISTPLGIISIFIPLLWPLLIDFPRYLTHSRLYQFLPPSLIQVIGYTLFASLVGWILYASLITTIIFTKRSIWTIWYLLLVFLLINNVAGCRESLNTSW